MKILPFYTNISRFGSVMLVSFSLILSGCLDDEESDIERQRKEDDRLVAEYLENNSINAERNNSGFYYQKTVADNAGEKVEDSDIVSFNYEMSLLDGTRISMVNEDTGTPVKIFYDADRFTVVPAGLNVGFGLMREGESFRFYLPAYLAFGSFSFGSMLPAHANLVLDVEIVKIDTKEEQNALEIAAIEAYIEEKGWDDVVSFSPGLAYKIMEEGDGSKPKAGNRVTVAYEGTYLDGNVFDKSEAGKPFTFTIGDKTTIDGFNDGIKLMEKGEKAILIIPSHLAFGGNVEVIPAQVRESWLTERQITKQILPYKGVTNQAPPFATLVYEIELQDVR